jgi:acylpyruvate hydrolase
MKNINIRNSDKNYSVGKIVCVGRNYAAHAKEMGNEIPNFPIIFLKPASSLIFNNDTIIHPAYSSEMHHEVELVLLVGRKIKNALDNEAEDAIIAYAVGLDMTLRDIQTKLKSKGHPWTTAKCFDTSAVVSEFVSKYDYRLQGTEQITLKVNNETRQNSVLSNMIFNPVEIVKYISTQMTLEEGDLIFTGTPEGVGKVERGDQILGEIEGVGTLINSVE